MVYFLENNPSRNITIFSQSVPNFVDYRDRTQSFESLIGSDVRNVNLSNDFARPDQANSVQISPGLAMRSAGHLVMGGGFLPEENTPGGPAVVVIGEHVWRERFDADPAVLERTLDIDRVPHRIIGVIGRHAEILGPCDV
ncbi:MAG: ABC transporter permease [Candidatus Synoicihabitans palmerolidicus]|nr:ABC transporter permease [Candidatus Synoicihabitans palmerolidicus]